jgi:hypothetical protein
LYVNNFELNHEKELSKYNTNVPSLLDLKDPMIGSTSDGTLHAIISEEIN